MKRSFQSWCIIVPSLLALFGAGVMVGRMTVPARRESAAPVAATPQDASAWVDTALGKLAEELKLDESQRATARESLAPVATSIFADQERALFQMHLRLLELHDTLAQAGKLNPDQLRSLGGSRLKLKELIIAKFPRMVRENPSPLIGGNP